MAFHLHRLKLVGRALHAAGYHKTDAADLAAARLRLSQNDVTTLAGRLGIAASELLRNLSAQDQREWAFYRVSAANPRGVWVAARAAWSAKGMTDGEAAAVMGFSANVTASAHRRPFALSFVAARRLSTALSLPGGPEALLPPQRDTTERNR